MYSVAGIQCFPFTSGRFHSPAVRHGITPYFFSRSEFSCWEDLLSRTTPAHIEISPWQELSFAQRLMEQKQPEYILSATTRTLYQAPVSLALARMLSSRFSLLPELEENIATCLHETIQNAIVHGNLELDSDFDGEFGMSEYYDRISERVHEEQYGNRCIVICASRNIDGLSISVTDRGAGFSLNHSQIRTSFSRPYGRGLDIVRSLCHHLHMPFGNTNTIVMDFI